MPVADLGLHVLALLVYPGALLTLAFGVVVEVAAGLVLDGLRPRQALLRPLLLLRRAAAAGPPAVAGAALLAVLAASQLAIPFNPVTPVERNLLVAAVAVAAACWAAWDGARARGTVLAQACWLVALLAPGLVSESLRPQALGAVAVPAEVPLKLAAAVVALLALPGVLQLVPARPAAAGDAAAAVRLVLWLPACGLFASLSVPPGTEDAVGVLRFLGIALVAAAAAIGAGVVARSREGGGGWLYPRLLVPAAAGVLAVAVLTAIVT